MRDAIVIEQLEVTACVGVPDEERARPQRLTVSLRMEPQRGFEALGDDLAKTVDYFAVCQELKGIAAARSWRLIETLGAEIAALVLERFAVAAVDVEVRKFILPDTAFVAVRLRRER